MNEMKNNDSQGRKYNDLCDTCKHYSTCVYIKNGKRPIFYCEEFEIQESEPVPEEPISDDSKTEEEYPVFTGLCKNCANRFTCMNAKPDKVIWHCEEYT